MAPGIFTSGGGAAGGMPAPAPAPVSGQGQSQGQGSAPVAPGVLQDALSYLERVQREFAGRQDVYFAFLSVMRDFKAGK
jgi:histone deacetylase complex regulatory component SIN3